MLKNIGEKIREYREEAGVSQKKLGMALGLSDKAVSSYESGRTLPPIETLSRISEELGVPMQFFLSDTPETTIKERLEKIDVALEIIQKDFKMIKKKLKKN